MINKDNLKGEIELIAKLMENNRVDTVIGLYSKLLSEEKIPRELVGCDLHSLVEIYGIVEGMLKLGII